MTPDEPRKVEVYIREEDHPLKEGAKVYRAYVKENRVPLYMGAESRKELEERLHSLGRYTIVE